MADNILKTRVKAYYFDFWLIIFVLILSLKIPIILVILLIELIISYISGYTIFGYIFGLKLFWCNKKSLFLYLKRLLYTLFYNNFVHIIPFRKYSFKYYINGQYEYDRKFHICINKNSRNINEDEKYIDVYKIDYFKFSIFYNFIAFFILGFIFSLMFN